MNKRFALIRNPRNLSAVVVAAGASLLPVLSHAAAIDVDDLVADIAAQAVPVGLIGGAVLLLMVGIKAFKWVRRAMS
ncbi:MAG: phage coat protein [Burkholderiales bacterium]|nr:phage coat protein [Burkholderiales bacterium]